MKKIKGHFWLLSHPSFPSNPSQLCAKRLAVRLAWTPKRDCKVTDNKERNQPQFYGGNPFKKKVHQKIETVFNFIKEIPLKMSRTKIMHRVPFY